MIQQELGAAQDSREAHLDAGLEVAAIVAAARIEVAQGLAILIVERPAVGAQREAAEDLVGACGIAHGVARPAREDSSARRRIAGPRGVIWPHDERARDDRPAIAVVTDRQVRSIGIEQLLLEREALRDESNADAMQSGAHAQAHRQPRRDLHHRAADVAVRERVILDTAKLGRVNEGAVEQDLQLEGFLETLDPAYRAARRSPQLRADLVLGVGREIVIDDEPAARAERQPFDPVVLREIEPRPVLRAARRERGIAYRHGSHAQPDREIALE